MNSVREFVEIREALYDYGHARGMPLNHAVAAYYAILLRVSTPDEIDSAFVTVTKRMHEYAKREQVTVFEALCRFLESDELENPDEMAEA